MKRRVNTANGCIFHLVNLLGALFFGSFTFGIGALIWAWVRYKKGYKNYCYSISLAYHYSIQAALSTEYLEGVIYILQNTINELDKFGISEYMPYKRQIGWQGDDNYNHSQIRGIPSTSNLRNLINMAQEFSRDWEETIRLGGVAAKIQAMETIRNLIRQEDIYLDWDQNLKFRGGEKIYRFDFTEEDYRVVTGLNNNTGKSGRTPHKPPTHEPPVDNSPTPPLPRKKILDFKEFLQQNPGLLYLSERGQREEYYKYLASMGVQPPSSRTRPTYQDDRVRDNGDQDNSVW